MSTSIGVREAKSRLSHYISRVGEGESVIITDHGRPVARLSPIADEYSTEQEVIQAMVDEGLIEPAQETSRRSRKLRPLIVPRRPVSLAALVRSQRR